MLAVIQQKSITPNIYPKNPQNQTCGKNPSFKNNDNEDPYKLIWKSGMVMFYIVALCACLAEIITLESERGTHWATESYGNYLLHKIPEYKQKTFGLLCISAAAGVACDYFYHKKSN